MYVFETSEDELDFDFRGRRREEIDESKSVWEWASIDMGAEQRSLHKGWKTRRTN